MIDYLRRLIAWCFALTMLFSFLAIYLLDEEMAQQLIEILPRQFAEFERKRAA